MMMAQSYPIESENLVLVFLWLFVWHGIVSPPGGSIVIERKGKYVTAETLNALNYTAQKINK